MDKPNCFGCKWKKNIPGDAHVCCTHPDNLIDMDDPLASLLSVLSGGGRGAIGEVPNALNVVGNPHGIRRGWFNWPFNFDPTWLENCDGFTQKENQNGSCS